MNIEEEIFKKTHFDINKLKEYGFIKKDNKYIYYKSIMNNKFKVEIIIDKSLSGKIYDIENDYEYKNFRIKNNNGEFNTKIKEEYINILLDIKEKCFINDYFNLKQSKEITNYILEKYNDKPEFLWEKYPDFGIFRNKNNNKWYAIIMNVDKSKISNSSGMVDILNIKSNNVDELVKKEGYYNAYHMNKKNWITIVLDNTVSNKEIYELIDESYKLVEGRR